MDNRTALLVGFVVGAGVGVLGAYRIMKNKYNDMLQEDREQLREHYERKYKPEKEEQENPVKKKEKTIDKVENIIKKENYTSYSEIKPVEEEEKVSSDPYIITPDDFGNDGQFDKVTLTFYSDGVLADELDESIDDVEGTVGVEFNRHFGEYEEDAVYVRNPIECIDYEVIRDYRNYDDVVKGRHLG